MPGKDVWLEALKYWYGDGVEQAMHRCMDCLIHGKMLYEGHRVIDQSTPSPDDTDDAYGHQSLWRIGNEPLVYVMQPYILGHDDIGMWLDFCDRYNLELELDVRAAFHEPSEGVGVTIWNRAVRQNHFRSH